MKSNNYLSTYLGIQKFIIIIQFYTKIQTKNQQYNSNKTENYYLLTLDEILLDFMVIDRR